MKHFARTLALAAVLAPLLAAPPSALAGRGEKTTPVTVVFDDVLGDAIQSDGLGPYGGSLRSRDGRLTVDTGARSLYVDIGYISGPRRIFGMTMTVSGLEGATATAVFTYDTGEEGLELTMTVSVARSGDAYVLAPTSDAEVWVATYERRIGRNPNVGKLVWTFLGYREMPWGAEVLP